MARAKYFKEHHGLKKQRNYENLFMSGSYSIGIATVSSMWEP